MNTDYRIYDTTGRKVLQGEVNTSNTVDLQSLESGIYFIEMKMIDMKTVLKFVKNKTN